MGGHGKDGGDSRTPEADPGLRTRAVLERTWRLGKVFVRGTLTLLLLFALMSYSPADPGFTTTGMAGEAVLNAVGAYGAWVADLLLYLFGYLAYVLPLWLAIGCYRSLTENGAAGVSWVLHGIRGGGFVLLLLSASALATLHFHAPATASWLAGGVTGGLAMDITLPSLAGSGATVLFLASGLFGLTVYFGIDWLATAETLGRWLESCWRGCRSFGAAWRERWRTRRDRGRPARAAMATARPVVEQRLEPLRITPPPMSQAPSARVEKERQNNLFATVSSAELPVIALLDAWDETKSAGYSRESLAAMSRLLELKVKDFGIDIEVTAVNPGPVITRFEVQPAPGVKVSRISNLVKDLARSLAVISVRVVEVIPGKTVVGIEIPNARRHIIKLSQVLSSPEFDRAGSPLSMALGHDIVGKPVIVDLAKMPHLLVAGTTGSGKSVGINAMILSLLFKSTPSDVRMIMIDPKMLELSVYDGIPHLLAPVITDMKDAANGLRWCVAEMERRYALMSALGVRNLAGFNRKVDEAWKTGQPLAVPPQCAGLARGAYGEGGWEGSGDSGGEGAGEGGGEGSEAQYLQRLPMIVVVVDELADMMMVVGKKVEELIARIAQKARAAGIHLILATQRPSVDVLTGLIKANIPTRLSFMVQSKVDSRTILGEGGAEQLLGNGDMLFLPPGGGVPTRVHGAFVSDAEVHRVADDWRSRGAPVYIDDITSGSGEQELATLGLTQGEAGDSDENDELYDEAVRFVTESRRASISAVQRKLRIGYNRAARMIECMETAGVVSEIQANGTREVIAPPPPE